MVQMEWRDMMLKALLHAQVRKQEKHYGYDALYVHDVIDTSAGGALKFAMVTMLSTHKEGVSSDAFFAAKLAGALCEDCGPCTQLCVDMATEAGVEPEKLAALLRGDIDQAGADAALGFRYGIAVATNADTSLALVETVRERFGEKGLVSLAFSVTSARMYPTLKRALGHGVACSKIKVSNETIAVKHAA
jgi:hypothetical protein